MYDVVGGWRRVCWGACLCRDATAEVGDGGACCADGLSLSQAMRARTARFELFGKECASGDI